MELVLDKFREVERFLVHMCEIDQVLTRANETLLASCPRTLFTLAVV